MVLPVMNRGGARKPYISLGILVGCPRAQTPSRGDQTDNVTLHHPVFEGEVGFPDWVCPPWLRRTVSASMSSQSRPTRGRGGPCLWAAQEEQSKFDPDP